MYPSNMMLNPLNKRHLEKVSSIDASLVTLNLEDAIAKSRKKEALLNIASFLEKNLPINSKIIVRVNPLNEGGKEEIEFLNQFNFKAIRVPKVKSKEEIDQALKLIKKELELHISLETKEAFYNIKDWKIDDRFTMANLGILDLLYSFSLFQKMLDINNPTIEYILSKFLLDCQSVDILPVSFMYQDYNNLEEFEAWCKKEKMMGFESKACMGPKQVEIANRIFGISADDIKEALEIKKAFEEHSKRGINGFLHPIYGFIDEPVYRDALLVLKKAGINLNQA
ncbi:MAG: CoA ester lyase [Epsilonproteobacteria bacterium]|nr:CoA ester lyase [Campylobacterota bacterium]